MHGEIARHEPRTRDVRGPKCRVGNQGREESGPRDGNLERMVDGRIHR